MSATAFCLDARILGAYAYQCKAQTPCLLRDDGDMKKTPSQIVAENLRALILGAGMVKKDGEPNQSTLARVSGADQRTVGRILAHEQSPTVDMLETIARAFGLHAWQLLIPGYSENRVEFA